MLTAFKIQFNRKQSKLNLLIKWSSERSRCLIWHLVLRSRCSPMRVWAKVWWILTWTNWETLMIFLDQRHDHPRGRGVGSDIWFWEAGAVRGECEPSGSRKAINIINPQQSTPIHLSYKGQLHTRQVCFVWAVIEFCSKSAHTNMPMMSDWYLDNAHLNWTLLIVVNPAIAERFTAKNSVCA